MKLILGIILFSIIIFGIMFIPLADAASGKLTIKGESSTIYSNESVYFKGKLTDSEGYARSFAPIYLWENRLINNAYEWKQIASGKTDARGNYKITVAANFWDYGKSVTIIANADNSIQSSYVTLNIEKPYSYQVKPEVKTYVNQKVDTNLVLKVRVGTIEDSVQLKPILTTHNGKTLSTSYIEIYVNNKIVNTISSNKWSSDMKLGAGFFTFTAKYDGAVSGTRYGSSSGQVNYDHTDSPSSSNTLKNPTTTINDNQYKDPSYKIKSKYYAALQELESGVKLSESSLSGIVFENSNAKKKLDFAWKLRYAIWGYIDEGKSILKQAELHLKNQNYQKAWEKLHQFDKEITSGKNHIYTISLKIKEGKELEDKYQEKNKSCFLFWCSVKDTTKGLDLKIKDLELNVQKIKNKQKDITLLYQMGVQNQKFVEQEYQSSFELEKRDIDILNEKFFAESEQNRLEQEKRQAEILTTETQQRLEEQIQREQRQYEEELRQQEQRRLQEQRQYEEELRQQQIQGEQERQRLEEKRLRELAEQRRQAEQERKRLEDQRIIDEAKNSIRLQAKHSPLIQGLINGGTLTFYFAPFENYVSQNVRTAVDAWGSWMDGQTINGVKLKRVYSNNADFTINWVRDYQEDTIGRQVDDYLIVGLGSSMCGEWRPFDAQSVVRLLWHEAGHALGQGHSNDNGNIMYPSLIGNKYEYDYDETITLSDGYQWSIPFCNSGSVFFETERLSSKNGYNVYVIPSNTNVWNVINGKSAFYTTCSAYENSMTWFNQKCNVERGSKLVLYNPSVFNAGSDLLIKVKIINKNSSPNVDMTFEKSTRYLTQQHIDNIKKLFQ